MFCSWQLQMLNKLYYGFFSSFKNNVMNNYFVVSLAQEGKINPKNSTNILNNKVLKILGVSTARISSYVHH